jgi:hypothetical protein
VTAPFPPPRKPGLRTLAPELTKIVEALAEAQARKDYAARHPHDRPQKAKNNGA